MLRAYKYLYYRIYAWNLRVWGESDMPQYNALFAVSFLVYLNAMTLIVLIDLSVGRRFVPLTRPIALALLLIAGVIGYFALVYRAKFRRLSDEFRGETIAQRRRRLIACVAYVGQTFLSIMLLVKVRNS